MPSPFPCSSVIRECSLKKTQIEKKKKKSYTAFLLQVRCAVRSVHVHFLQLFVPDDNVFAQPIFVEHTSCLNVVNFKVDK